MPEGVEEVLRKYWGFEGFLPLQKEAMTSVCSGRDSIVVLPTGGGKSLCFQAPALVLPGLTLVISPLLSLMKDQVDALLENGIPAARLDSTVSNADKIEIYNRLRGCKLKLLYVSPERLMMEGFLDFLKAGGISSVAVDEAHCVSMWGHDFRPEYRQLRILRDALPGIPIGAYTATATEHVRRDIAEQLGLDRPEIFVGRFDRPNLLYRVRRRANSSRQISDVLERHRGESGIIYCIRRADVDEMSRQLTDRGYIVAPYHAGMTDEERKESQNAFIDEKVDIIVATVAFGMGIDKSNVRYVIHAGMPKSLEHYQQESGRAGRDGLDAECLLFYSGADYLTWKRILEESEPQVHDIAAHKLGQMYRYCSGVSCRHKAIINYFGQDLDQQGCQACDICLGEIEGVPDALVVAQKILSSVLRQGERFGADYTAGVLTGSREDRIVANHHDELSTYGLLSKESKSAVRDWIEQLVEQECVERVGEYGVLKLTDKGRRVLKGKEQPLLLEPAKKKPTPKPAPAKDSWEGVDRGLFDELRLLRRKLAQERAMPAYIVFGDAALRDMARKRPSTSAAFLRVSGVGEKKLEQYGEAMLSAIRHYCLANSLDMDHS
ncbi:MAG: DNA helicase RecQ [Acidobacteriia bacterium]|nr:DNA helicase RecQ [Terriglobia bacterium]